MACTPLWKHALEIHPCLFWFSRFSVLGWLQAKGRLHTFPPKNQYESYVLVLSFFLWVLFYGVFCTFIISSCERGRRERGFICSTRIRFFPLYKNTDEQWGFTLHAEGVIDLLRPQCLSVRPSVPKDATMGDWRWRRDHVTW